MTCNHCNGSGSLSRDPDGMLDCLCGIADERAALDLWARRALKDAPSASTERWMIYQRGKQAATPAPAKRFPPRPAGPMGPSWAPTLTPEEQAEREQDIQDGTLPF